jgi:hypothetical protein
MLMRMRLYVLSLWDIIDPVYYFFTRLTYIEKANEEPKCIFRVRLTKYKGRAVTLSDGTEINKNDLLVKIHLHNVRLLREMYTVKSDIQKALIIYKQIKRSMPLLAKYINEHEERHAIKGIIGITMLDKGCTRLGFEKKPIGNGFYKWFKLFTVYPIYFLSTSQLSKLVKPSAPHYLFMSTDSLLHKYFSDPSIKAEPL